MTVSSAPGLYLHLPFCCSICPYCDFYVLKGGPLARHGFVDRLIREIERHAARTWPEFVEAPPEARFDTIYLGGGTPSHLPPEELARLLEACRRHLPISPTAHLSLEANPEDVSRETLESWRALGVAMLSLGVQSFSASGLRFLGRNHDAEQGRRATELALSAGFETVSLDLIFGLPDQSPAHLRKDLESAVELAPDHLSLYQLTIHEGTPFGFRRAHGRLEELPNERQADLFLLIHELLSKAGYDAYEVSNFARRPRHRSCHNQKYWRHVPYLGLGPSAHSFAGRHRWWSERKIKPWSARVDEGRSTLADRERLEPWQLVLERLMLGLRTREGVDLEGMPDGWGLRLREANRELLEDLGRRGLLTEKEGTLLPTTRGLALADSLPRGFVLPGP